MRGGMHLRSASPTVRPAHHGTNMRRALVSTSCLKCTAQQLFMLPKLQPNNQQLRRHPQCSVEEPSLLHQQLQQSAAVLDNWQPAWAAAGGSSSSSSSSSQLADTSPQHPSVFSMQGDEASCVPRRSSRDGDSVTTSSSSSGTPVILDMPPLADLLGEAAAGNASSTPSATNSSSSILDTTEQEQQEQQQRQQQQETDSQDSPGVRAALAMLRWYKGALSPMMASTCRFLPTCSQYSMDSYRAYGVAKGTVLTAWRLLRCNPWGPSGYDPTAWPPVGLAWLFRVQGSAEVAVVVGLAAFVRLSHALLFE